ncbi:M56 family metallopeptidase [Algoriphagus chordae]|uniref:Beta-lactamase regulating signal transducer with metallopeptidase domain n=1 Tax=Algoriphagus chordae TaxID=237019 RepID=A0A2W7QY39_9BACT|nr:M56 family metallopeptidase [Algoriphagus chordae]PZX52026.1 beta-lactamase regulating signal transducer with metallopeptidase domain [Algoriphagus chordae]
MITYLVKSIACLVILLLVHRLLLQREAMHRFNRFFLLFSVVVSFLIPLYTIEVPQEITAPVEEVISEPVFYEASPSEVISEPVYSGEVSPEFNQEQVFTAVAESSFNWEYLLFGLYTLISLVFLYRFGRNIKVLVNKIQRNIKINYRGQTLVLLKEDSLPFSFLKYIFVAESDMENGKFTDAVFAHECTHIEEKHSWDNLFIEALLVPLWFHPGLHWAKASIKLNHEFIADQIALRSTPIEKYESQLLAMMLSEQKFGLASSLNFSLTKKRFEMMKRKSKNSSTWIKVFALVPVLGALVYFFSERVTAKSDETNQESEVYVNISNQSYLEDMDFDLTFSLKPNGVIEYRNEIYALDAVKELISESKKSQDAVKINLITESGLSMGDLSDFQAVLRELNIRRIYYYGTQDNDSLGDNASHVLEKEKYFGNVMFLIENDQQGYAEKKYAQLSEREKSLLRLPPNAPTKKTPSDSVYDGFRTDKDLKIWFDGEEVSKQKLEAIEVSDIAYYKSTPIYENLKSNKFPQLPIGYNVSLFTDNYYQKVYGPDADIWKPKKGTITITPRGTYGVDMSIYPDPVNAYNEHLDEYIKLSDQADSNFTHILEKQLKVHASYSLLVGMYYQLNAGDKSKVVLPVAPPSPVITVGKREEAAEQIEENEKHYRNASFFVIQESGELLEKTYQMLSDQEKKMLVPPPPPTKKSIPTSEEFESWKNPDTFALWLNGTVISNDKLNQMKSNDIVYYYSGAARSNKNLKEHQVYLYNQKGFDKYYGGESGFTDPLTKEDTLYLNPTKNEISRGNAWVKKEKDPVAAQKVETADKWPPGVKAAQIKNDLESYIDAYAAYEKLRKQAPHFVNRSKAEQEKLTEMYSELRSMYFQVAFHDKPKVRRAVVPYVPYIKLTSKGEVYYKKGEDLTAEELSIVGPPPPPPTPAELLESYKRVSYQYEFMRNKSRNDASLSMEERNTLFLMYNELQVIFLNMGAPERRQVKMVNFPYYRVEENGKSVFKAVSELTPEQKALNNC